MPDTLTQPGDNPPARRRRPPVTSTLPEQLAEAFTPVPRALFEHGGALGLTPAERALVCALWSFKWYADSAIRPSTESLVGSARCVHRHRGTHRGEAGEAWPAHPRARRAGQARAGRELCLKHHRNA